MLPDIINKIKQLLLENNLNLASKRTLLAVSGGVDSVVMVALFHQLQYKFAIAHCNFQLRGEESNGDEAFVKALAEKYHVPFYSNRFETLQYAESNSISIQVAARELRYEWFEQIRTANKYNYIATAHHLNDNIETVLFNFIKGTGIKGLRGMQPRRGNIIRPLLLASRDEIDAYRQEQGLDYREDSSNAGNKYTRNKIRHLLVPLINEINPGFETGFGERLKVFADLEALYQNQTSRINKQLFEKRGSDIYIPIRRLKKLIERRSLLFDYLHPMGFTASQIDDMLEALDGDAGKQFLSPEARIIKDRRFLILTQNTQPGFTAVLVQKQDTEILLPNGKLEVAIEDNNNLKIKKEKQYAYFDMAKLEFPLILRQWKKGDYFYPFGMGMKKKKVSKYFKDQKIPLHEKDTIWILESGRKIAWVAGERLDERYKITPQTKQVLVIKLQK